MKATVATGVIVATLLSGSEYAARENISLSVSTLPFSARYGRWCETAQESHGDCGWVVKRTGEHPSGAVGYSEPRIGCGMDQVLMGRSWEWQWGCWYEEKR